MLKINFTNKIITKSFKKDVKYLGILLILFLLFTGNNLYIINKDQMYLHADTSNYFQKSMEFYEYFTSIPQSTEEPFWWIYYNRSPLQKPPFFMLSSFPFFHLFGFNTDVARLTNLPYMLLLIIFMYYLGKKIHSRKAGFLSAVITFFIPAIYGVSRSFMLEIATAALVIISLYFYMQSNVFKNRKYAMLFGLCFGIGMMIRWDYAIFVFFWPLIELLGNFKKVINNKKQITNIIISIWLALLIFGPWYFVNTKYIISAFTPMVTQQNPGIWITESVYYYFIRLYQFHFGSLVFPVILLLLVNYIFVTKVDYKWKLLFSVIVPLLIFTLIQNRQDKYIIPVLPLIVLCVSISIVAIKNKIIKHITLVIFIALLIFQSGYTQISHSNRYIENRNNAFYIYYPESEFEFEVILNYFKNQNLTEMKHLIIINFVSLNPLEYLFHMYNISINSHVPFDLIAGKYFTSINYDEIIDNSDYILLFSDHPNDLLIEMEKEFISHFYKRKNEFELIAEFYSDYYKDSYQIYKKL